MIIKQLAGEGVVCVGVFADEMDGITFECSYFRHAAQPPLQSVIVHLELCVLPRFS
mgnify:CR=1 FL=1